MGKLYEAIDGSLRGFIEAQQMFFVATAPSGADGHLNLSPKGLDTLRVLGPRRVAYLDYVGSGAETIAHVKQNGRIVIMLCAFQGPPRIVRLHGRGTILEPQQAEYAHLCAVFPPHPAGRSIVDVSVDRISDSCGFGVPLYDFQGHRSQLVAWCDHKGVEGLERYQVKKNATSIDGLPALGWAQPEDVGS